MERRPLPLEIIVNYQKIGKFALNVVVAALETDARAAGVPVRFATSEEMLVAMLGEVGGKALVLWSFYSPDFLAASAMLGRVKDATGEVDAVHFAGGVHASAEPEKTLLAGFDLVAIGEGEQTIVDAVCTLLDGGDVRALQGVAFLGDDGAMRKNGKGKSVALDDFPPFSDRHSKFGPIEITRGCVFACSFCQTPFVNGARFRHRSVEQVCQYAAILVRRNMRDYRFLTPTAMSYGAADGGVNLDAVEELLRRMRETIGTVRHLYYGTFPSEIRPEHVSHEALALIKRYADNDNIIIGGQSGSDAMLRRIHRGHDVEAVRRAVRIGNEAGFSVNVDFLFGLPEESPEDAEATRQLAEELAALGARIHTHTFMPLPGTPLQRAPAGSIDKRTRSMLLHLEATGKAYGLWKQQEKTASELEALRKKLD